MPVISVLVVDDRPALRAGLRGLLEHEPGIRCIGAVAGERAFPAAVAQADAIVAKSAPVQDRLDATGSAARGAGEVPRPDPELIQAAASRVREDDLPVLGMLFARVP